MTQASHDTAVRHKRGGLYFEDFVVGSLTEHRYTRTVTQMDNMLFSNMTLNPQPLHIDRHFCERETEWGQPLMNSLFTLGLMIGIQVSDMTVGTTIANLGMTDVKFPHPLFEGDTVHCTTEVVGKRESKSRPNARPVEFHRRAYNQDHTLVAECSHGVRRGQLRIECDRRLLMALRYRTKVLISCPVLGPQQRCRNGASVATRM
jgi:acyl dehydratase